MFLIYIYLFPFIEFIGSFVLNLHKSRYVVSNDLSPWSVFALFFRPTSKASLQIARIEEAKREEERIAAEAEEVRSRDFVGRLGSFRLVLWSWVKPHCANPEICRLE